MKICKSKPEATILSAVKKYVEWIAPTYGPAGKKILIVQNELNHEAVDDGKRATQNFEIEDEFENAVITHIKGVNEKCKDGNTTAGLIAGNIVIEAFKDLNNELATPDYHGMAVSLEKALEEAVKQVVKSAKKIKSKEELYAIAHNSYNNDKIAKLIADTVFAIGKDGVLKIGDSNTAQTTVEMVNGLEIPAGYNSKEFINTETKDRVVLENPAILLVNKKINLFVEIAPLIKSYIDSTGNRGFVVIADGFGSDVVDKCIGFKQIGMLQPLLIDMPGYGDKAENLSDIGMIVNAKVIDDKTLKLKDATKDHLGSCETVESLKDLTSFLGAKGKVDKEYINVLKAQLEKSTNNFEKDTLTQRIAVLSGGVAVIKVGAYTENEQKGIKAKVENAVNSTQMAFKSGAVQGAAKSLLDIKTSSELLNKALKAPRQQLEDNGVKYLDENTVDPADVIITALESAVSIASGLLTMGGISVPKREKKDDTRF